MPVRLNSTRSLRAQVTDGSHCMQLAWRKNEKKNNSTAQHWKMQSCHQICHFLAPVFSDAPVLTVTAYQIRMKCLRPMING